MMPRKKKNGSRSDSPEKNLSLHLGFPRSSPNQYGSSNRGKSGDVQRGSHTGDSHVPDNAEQDQRFQQLQDMFQGQVDADVVYVILSECDWKVEAAVEELLKLTVPTSQNPSQGPTLKTVANSITASSNTMASGRHQSASQRQDLALNLRSRLPSVHGSDPTMSRELPMLSPRTPSVAGPDFPSFPQGSDREDSIHVALEALDSYAQNPELSSYLSSFQSQMSYDGGNIFDTQMDGTNSQINTFDPFALHQGATGLQHGPPEGNINQLSNMPSFGPETTSSQDSYTNMGQLNMYSQTFQPIHTASPPVLPTTSYAASSNSFQEPVSPRTAFNNVILGETALMPDDLHRRPVREDSKDSATSDVSRVSDLSEESVVNMSPGLVPKRHHRQVLRRQNISLDPQERASLEQLIEEVLIGGVDDGVMDSDDSSDDDDEEFGEGSRIKRLSRSEDGSKVAPSQLKVAAKHMKNLPPRFLKRLQATQPNATSGDEEVDIEGIHIEEPKVEEKKKPKKKTKHLLDSLDQYVEDDVPVTDPESEDGDGASESLESPGAAPGPYHQIHQVPDPAAGTSTMAPYMVPRTPPPPAFRPPQQPIILRPNVMNYNDLDPERVVRTPPRVPQQSHGFRPQSRDHTPEPHLRVDSHQGQRFSLDAPEFVPRSFNPINPPSTHTHMSSPVSHLREGYTVQGPYCFSPRSGSPYTVHSGGPYQGRSGSPYHLGLTSNLSPQMPRRSMTGSPIGMVQVAPTGRHSPIPPAFFIPKAPQTAAAAAAAAATAAMHGHAAGLLHYSGYPVPHFPVHPHPSNMRYAVPPGYRPPFMPPGTGAHRMPHPGFKYSPKERLQNSPRPSSAPTVAPGASTSPRMAANLLGNTVQAGMDKHTTPFQKVFGKPASNGEGGNSKLDKDVKEAKNFSTQCSRTSKSSLDEDLSPQEKVTLILGGGSKLMVIMRGVAGSGKSHLAKELVDEGMILSTDDFFVTAAGYEFDYAKIGEAHEWNQKRAKQALQEGKNPVIIDNTNTQSWEMKPYVLMAVKQDYLVEIVEPGTPWKFRAKELAKRNKHGVTKEFIQRMIDRYEHNVTVESIVASSEKIKIEVEKKQRQAAQQALQEISTASQEGQPTEERKTKKKTRRGKGRKKKARLRELREAEANKEREKTGDEASSDEESTPEGDQSIDKTSVEEGTSLTESNAPTVSQETSDKTNSQKDIDSPVAPTAPVRNSSSGVDDVFEKEERSTPEKKLHTDSVSEQAEEEKTKDEAEVKEKGKPKLETDGNISDESDSSRDSVSEPSTAESQLSQESDTEAGASSELSPEVLQGAARSDSPADSEDMMRDQQLLQIVMNSLEINLHAMLQTKQGPAKAHLKTLLAKYQSSSEVREEIEEIIKEKMFEGMVNREVEEITGGGGLSLDRPSPAPLQTAKSLTETDVNSIMDVLGQITNVDSDSDNDTNNNQSNADKPTDDSTPDSDVGAEDTASDTKRAGEVTLSSALSSKVSSAAELRYWQTDRMAHDPYAVGAVSVRPRTKSQASFSDSSSSEVTWENRPKARRERKRPYKKPKLHPEEFWNVSTDKQDENIDSANSSVLSSEPGSTPQTPTTPENGVRSRRLSGRNRLAAQFPMPELDPSEKHKLLIKDWQLPDFAAQQVPFSPPVHHIPRPTLDAETYTHPKDFAAIQRLLQPSQGSQQAHSYILDEGFVGIRDTQPRVIYQGDKEGNGDEQKSEIAHRLMIHQSCSTEELERESRPDGLLFLQSCFGTVAEDDLREILGRCEGDVEWAANILLDAGYEYNEQPTQSIPQISQAAPQVPQVKSNSASPANPHTSERNVYGLPTLTQLCHQLLQPSETLTENVQEKFVKTSLQRLNSITEFQRQHSSSSTTEVGGSPERRDRTSISSLDLAPKSPESDLFYSPLEAPVPPGSSLFPSPPRIPSEICEENVDGGATTRPTDGREVDEMTLALSPALAKQLISLFGPVGFHITGDSLATEDLVVKLTRKTAKQLHRRWALTLQDTFNYEENAIKHMIDQDEALAKRMQAEEDEQHQAELRERVASRQQPCEPPESLKEIMEEQMAIALSKQEHTKVQDNLSGGGPGHADSLATKMKRQKLLQMFPKVDHPTLEEIYKATGYNMTKTVSTIRASFGVDEPVQNVWTPEAVQAYEDMLLRQAVDRSLQDEWLGADEQEEADPLEALQDPQYQDLRAEASAHYRLRHECFQKAQEAHRRGLKSVACFYSQQGHLHTQKLKEANRRAAATIIQIRNQDVGQTNTIDLHGLHVDETLSILDDLITQRERELRQRYDKRKDHLYVVTGRGSHSRGGKARIRPAVIDYLTRKQYSFSEGIPGMLKVQMRYRDDL